MNTVKIGAWGENEACKFLKSMGYEVIEKNYHSRYGEIDIVAKDKDCLVFAEVKTRKNKSYGNACEYVTRRKQEKIIRTAEKYIKKNPETEIRFDVIEIYYHKTLESLTLKEINHIINAFICENQ